MNNAAAPSTVLPRSMVVIAAAMFVFALTAVAFARFAGVPPAASPEAVRAQARIAPVASRSLRFLDRADGAVVITDVRTGGPAAVIQAGEKTGFIRGVMRGLARDRHARGIGATPSFELTLWRNGQLSLTDSATGRSIELTAFGASNRAAFAALLPGGAS